MSDVVRSVVIEVEVKPKDVDLGPIAQALNKLSETQVQNVKKTEVAQEKSRAQEIAALVKQGKLDEAEYKKKERAIQQLANEEAKAKFKKIQLAERLAAIERKKMAEEAAYRKEHSWNNRLTEGAESFSKGGGIGGALGKIGGTGVALAAGKMAFNALDEAAGTLAEEMTKFQEILEKGDGSLEGFASAATEYGHSVLEGMQAYKLRIKIFGDTEANQFANGKVTVKIGGSQEEQDKRKFDNDLKLLQLKDQAERKAIDTIRERTQVERDLMRSEQARLKDFQLEFGLMNKEQQNQIKEVDRQIKSGGISSLNSEQLELAKSAGLHRFKSNEAAINQNATSGGFDSLNVVQESMQLIKDLHDSITRKVEEGKREFQIDQTVAVIVQGLEGGKMKSELRDSIEKIVQENLLKEITKLEQARNAANGNAGAINMTGF